jgi:hypothetical protein
MTRMSTMSSRLAIPSLLAMAALTGVSSLMTGPALAEDHAIAYRRIGVSDYQNFLVNWDDKKQGVLYALIQTPAHYEALFHPAPTNFSTRPFAPGAKMFATEQILVVGRVMAAPGDMNKVFDVEQISETDHQLTFRYRFHDPRSTASYTVKNYLAVWIPKRPYKSISFFENGKLVGELKLSQGQWSVPVMTPERDDALPGRKN